MKLICAKNQTLIDLKDYLTGYQFYTTKERRKILNEKSKIIDINVIKVYYISLNLHLNCFKVIAVHSQWNRFLLFTLPI